MICFWQLVTVVSFLFWVGFGFSRVWVWVMKDWPPALLQLNFFTFSVISSHGHHIVMVHEDIAIISLDNYSRGIAESVAADYQVVWHPGKYSLRDSKIPF